MTIPPAGARPLGEANAVVAIRQSDSCAAPPQHELHFVRARVLAHIGQRFLCDTKELGLRAQR